MHTGSKPRGWWRCTRCGSRRGGANWRAQAARARGASAFQPALRRSRSAASSAPSERSMSASMLSTCTLCTGALVAFSLRTRSMSSRPFLHTSVLHMSSISHKVSVPSSVLRMLATWHGKKRLARGGRFEDAWMGGHGEAG
jgi:hypothetical protein